MGEVFLIRKIRVQNRPRMRRIIQIATNGYSFRKIQQILKTQEPKLKIVCK